MTDAKLPAALELGAVVLTVADVQRSTAFYREVLGLEVLDEAQDTVWLGVSNRRLLKIEERADARPSSRENVGLFHFALLVPGRAELATFLRHLARSRHPIQGMADHRVSEAIYLADPDGHGIEVYRDRPREEWRWQDSQVHMTTESLDTDDLLAAAPEEDDWTGMSAGTRMGHVHLRVANLDAAVEFYCQVLGFDLVAEMPGARFVSAGGYHHHIGLNVWHSRNGTQADPGTARLEAVNIFLPSETELEDLAERASADNYAVERADGELRLRDPFGIPLRFRVGRSQ